MDIALKVNLALLTLLSISSGIAKILLLPQDLKFFGDAGFSETMIVIYGVAQLVGGVLLIIQKSRLIGAVVMVLTLSISTIIIFMDGQIGFGIFSILPILMAAVVINTSLTRHRVETLS